MHRVIAACESMHKLPMPIAWHDRLLVEGCNAACLMHPACLVSRYESKTKSCEHYSKCAHIRDVPSPFEAKEVYFMKRGAISFDTCGGYTNQKLSLIQGIKIAEELRWDLVLPKLNANGEQTQGYAELHSRSVPFEYFYKPSTLEQIGTLRLLDDATPRNFTRFDIARYKRLGRFVNDIKGAYLNVRITCPLLRFEISPQDIRRINGYLEPSDSIRKAVEEVKARLPGSYYALHYRMEDDWIQHCRVWSTPTRRNCLTNSDKMRNLFQIEAIRDDAPVYVMGAANHSSLKFLRNVYAHSFSCDDTNREWCAAVDYLVALGSDKFIGNSVSTFSAFMLLERSAPRDFWYNGGNIPLFEVLFGKQTSDSLLGAYRKKLKWAFVYSSYTRVYNEYVRAAVQSAIRNTDMVPVCIYFGPPDEMYSWFVERGVRVVLHDPQWKGKILDAFEQTRVNINFASTYKSPHTLIATYLRIDIPTLGFRDDYVLYTDADVLFLKTPAFGPFYAYYATGAESDANVCGFWHSVGRKRKYVTYGNAGVMYMNINNLRYESSRFEKFAFSDDNLKRGLHHGLYGPADQGAYNEYFQGLFDCVEYPPFNWKPYWPSNEQAAIVHFHGPKIPDYVAFLHNGSVLNKNYEALLQRCTGCGRYVQAFATMHS